MTVNIVQGGSVVASITGGTNMGLNTVSWTPTVGGTFGINIAAAASGFPFWTQISVDTNSGMEAYSPAGIDVDKNTNSPYYGRVVMSCSQTGSGTGAQIDGLYKMNADGTQADEGWYGYAGYINDDGGDPTGVGQMPSSGGYNPMCIRIGDDDRIYWCDNSAYGAILSCDMLASTNNGYLIVIDEGTYSDPFVGVSGHLGGPHNYRNCPEIGDLDNGGGYGIQQFDVTATTTSNAAVWLVDFADSPNWGVWMFHMTNGQSDPADQKGTQAVATGGALTTTSSGIMVDSNLDVFISQNIGIPGATNQRCLDFKSWNGGVPPPEGGGYNYALSNGPPTWQSGGGTSNLLGIRDTVLDSRAHPKYVALPLSTNNSAFAGVCVLSASNGLVVSVTNGATIQTLTNIDMANKYVGAGWDNVGNLYGVSSTAQLWRVWSPPGAGTNTTLAIVQVCSSRPPGHHRHHRQPYDPGLRRGDDYVHGSGQYAGLPISSRRFQRG